METPVSLIPCLMPCEKTSEEKKTEDTPCLEEGCENNEITVVTGSNEEDENLTIEDYTRRYSLKQLREMCTKQNLSNVGNKKELAERIKKNIDHLMD